MDFDTISVLIMDDGVVPFLKVGSPVLKVCLLYLCHHEGMGHVGVLYHLQPILREVDLGAFFSFFDLAEVDIVFQVGVTPDQIPVVYHLINTHTIELGEKANDGSVLFLPSTTVREAHKWPKKDKKSNRDTQMLKQIACSWLFKFETKYSSLHFSHSRSTEFWL